MSSSGRAAISCQRPAGVTRMLESISKVSFPCGSVAKSRSGAAGKRQVHEQVLRLHAQGAVGRHREPKKHRRAPQFRTHYYSVPEVHAEQPDDAFYPLLLDLAAIINLIEHCTGIGVEADVPDPFIIRNLGHGLDNDAHAVKVGDPPLYHPRKSNASGAAGV